MYAGLVNTRFIVGRKVNIFGNKWALRLDTSRETDSLARKYVCAYVQYVYMLCIAVTQYA